MSEQTVLDVLRGFLQHEVQCCRHSQAFENGNSHRPMRATAMANDERLALRTLKNRAMAAHGKDTYEYRIVPNGCTQAILLIEEF
jgi:hypothetical protein